MANEVVQFGAIARAVTSQWMGIGGCRMWETDDGMMRKWVLLRKFSSAPPSTSLNFVPFKMESLAGRVNEVWDEKVPK